MEHDIPIRKLVAALLAISFGTIIEVGGCPCRPCSAHVVALGTSYQALFLSSHSDHAMLLPLCSRFSGPRSLLYTDGGIPVVRLHGEFRPSRTPRWDCRLLHAYIMTSAALLFLARQLGPVEPRQPPSHS
jgi:hypothetical protein